ncbi:hypothetical protein [Mesorhizobium sp. M0520]|uniref:hypothetical protein n=1 Tax=unclassified Mesorhizobium TaxID=325217 RepID=UPI00333C8262
MHVERKTVAITTAADGSATAYTEGAATGRILQARYVKTDFADGVDFTITSEATGETIWQQSDVNASATVAPRQPTHSTAGVAALFAAAGAAVNDHIAIANDRIKIVIAAGGNAKTGTFHFLIG